MDETPPPLTSTSTTTLRPPDHHPQPQTPSPPPSTPSLPPLSSSLLSTSSTQSSQNPNPATPNSQNPQTRQPFTNRQWPQQPPPSHFSHFSTPSFSNSSSMSVPPRVGMAIGVPAHHPNPPPPPPPVSFSSLAPPSFGQQFGGLGRNLANVNDSVAGSSTSQAGQPLQRTQGMGMMGSLGSSSPMRPGSVSAHQQLRPGQSVLRPQTSPSNQTPASQDFQGHGMLRVSSAGSPSPTLPNTPQSSQPPYQPWLSSGSQGKPPLPSSSLRPQMNPQSLQQRSHIPQQHHSLPTTSQQQQPSSIQQPSPAHQPQEHYGQQFTPSRIQQSLPHQQQIITRSQGLGNQKPSFHATVQPSTVPLGPSNRTSTVEPTEICNRILSKRSIRELVTQIDPSESLDPDVEDILVDIADDFMESITTFGCSLAKHRKSSILEAKDILLHLERNWNMTLPGFSGDEIKIYKKPSSNDIHRERLSVIKKSIVTAEMQNTKSSAGQAGGNVKVHPAKAPANIIGSPNSKLREAA